jgi:hypothetical protein
MTDEPEEQPDGIGNAVDPVVRKRAAEKQRQTVESGDAYWRRQLADPVGRREIWGIITSAHTFETQFACGPNGFPQPEHTWFAAGEQQWGQRFYLKMQRIDREGVWRMQDEHDPTFAKAGK